MSFDVKLLDVLACPVCKGKLVFSKDKSQLLCRFDRLSFAVESGIPVLIESHAKQLTLEEMDDLQ